VQFDARIDEPRAKGIITSFAYPGWWRKNDYPDFNPNPQ
jgi:hypothetical protein